MKIEPIIYQTTRGLYNMEDKLSISSLVLFCWKLGGEVFAELLYTDNYDSLINKLTDKYENYDIDLSIKLEEKQIRECLIKTIEKVRDKCDADGYYKALYEKDELAIMVNEITSCAFALFSKT